jgi:hypothetical protein
MLLLPRRLATVFAHWPQIRNQLAEPNRQRPRYPYLG